MARNGGLPMSFDRITHDPLQMGGKPCIRGLRVTVGAVLGLLASGRTRFEILQAYPYLESDDIDQVLGYVKQRLRDGELPDVEWQGEPLSPSAFVGFKAPPEVSSRLESLVSRSK